MFARSITIEGRPGALDSGIDFVRDEVLPSITSMDGCLGLSMVVDRETGRCIVTSSWDTYDALEDSYEPLARFRIRGGELMGGSPRVEEWEVAAMHRAHTSHGGACCRITWARPPDLDRGIEMWRAEVLPRLEAMPGFCSASMLFDREGGRVCGTVTYDTREALEQTRETARAIREESTSSHGVQFLDVAEMDLAVAQLRLPELI